MNGWFKHSRKKKNKPVERISDRVEYIKGWTPSHGVNALLLVITLNPTAHAASDILTVSLDEICIDSAVGLFLTVKYMKKILISTNKPKKWINCLRIVYGLFFSLSLLVWVSCDLAISSGHLIIVSERTCKTCRTVEHELYKCYRQRMTINSWRPRLRQLQGVVPHRWPPTI